ncbi:MAG: DUF4249 family protein [Bacteroidales bacterium]|nr:DUF4249 family protein [Bacteroidales bacterium]
MKDNFKNIILYKGKNFLFHIGLILLLLIMSRCDEVQQQIDWETKNVSQMLVVEGSVVSDTTYQCVKLSLSDDYFANKPSEKVLNASVTVDDGTNTFTFVPSDTAPGSYYSEFPFAGVAGKNYSLDIHLQQPVNEIYDFTAQSLMPYVYDIDTIIAVLYDNPIFFGGEDEDSTILFVIMNGITVPEVSYCYLINLYKNGISIYESYVDGSILEDSYVDLDEDRSMLLTYTERFDEGDTLGIEVYSITKAFYDFLYALKQISQPADLFGFSGTKGDAIGNINGGKQLGFFYTASISRVTTYVIKEDFEKKNGFAKLFRNGDNMIF